MTNDLPQLVQRLTERAKKLSGHIDECRDNAIDCNGVLQPNYEDEDGFEFCVPCSQCLSAGVSLREFKRKAMR